MNYFKCIIAYDGTDYCGWQYQPNKPTITGVLKNTFENVFCQKATIVGASRTDAGVHAYGQVALCRTELALEAQSLLWAWNNRLPSSITIRACTTADQQFHPQRNVYCKTYQYHICTERPLPYAHRYQWFVRKCIDYGKLADCLQIFVGTHNFRSFCTGHERGDDTIRTIDSITFDHNSTDLVITVKGQAFLHYMIRRIVGATISVACHSHIPVNYINKILLACNPLHHLPTAPASGLVLQSIEYKN